MNLREKTNKDIISRDEFAKVIRSGSIHLKANIELSQDNKLEIDVDSHTKKFVLKIAGIKIHEVSAKILLRKIIKQKKIVIGPYKKRRMVMTSNICDNKLFLLLQLELLTTKKTRYEMININKN